VDPQSNTTVDTRRYSRGVELISTGAAALKAAGPTVSATRAALKRLRLWGTYQVEWLDLDASDDGFTTRDVGDIQAWLASEEMRPILSLLAVTLLAPDLSERAQAIEVIREAFANNAKRWSIDRGTKWAGKVDAVWNAVLGLYVTGSPSIDFDIQTAAQEFSDFVQSPFGTGGSAKTNSVRYVERLGELAANIDRVATAIDAANQVREAIADTPTPPIITYTETSKPATFSDLYVSRSLIDEEVELEVDSSQLGSLGGPFRVVVQGAPGAGKSTFVRHLRHELAEDEAAGQPALLLTIRHYVNTARSQTLLDYLLGNARSTLNLEIKREALRDAMTLGLVVVIFDGLDEITDINLRADMVERIVSFGREYPAISMLVTSRTIGYDRAPLPKKNFATLKLDQYSPTQSEEYVRRWFTFIERPDLIPEFARESHTVADLKANPLLLSLLCVLYRERGSIPRRRRDIYASCADLLFHTWDSHRHIGQPEELHANGDRIMQEIARWVYTSQAAQSGLSERIIQKSIGIYLEDHLGVEEGEARRRAGEFLEFCATRAWLLATVGTQHGERLFGFTHRTFFEYFAAEAFARQGSDPDRIAQTIVEAHERDATSVLPELLLQAFDDKVDRGAAEVFKLICARMRDEVLILRLMEGVPLPSRIREVGFSRVLEVWREEKGISESSFVALLTLNSDARGQFVKQYLQDEARSDYRLLFLSAWVSLDLAGRAHRHETLWREAVTECAERCVGGEVAKPPPVLECWLWLTGYTSLPIFETASLFRLPTAMRPRVGYLWMLVERLSRTPEDHAAPDMQEITEAAISYAKRARSRLPYSAGDDFESSVSERLLSTKLGTDGHSVPDGAARWAVLYAVALLDETGGMTDALERSLVEAFGTDPQVLIRSRAAALGVESYATPTERTEAGERLRQMPVWLRGWAKGNRSFVHSFGE
jgi:hypothetical protein